MKAIKTLALLLCALIILTALTACDINRFEKPKTDEELIEERIDMFLTAYNSGDMETVLSCLDAKTRNAFEVMFKLMGGLAGSYTGIDIDISDLFSLGIYSVEDDFMELNISEINIESDKKATVTATMDMPNSKNIPIYIYMVYENEGWYIRDMRDY